MVPMAVETTAETTAIITLLRVAQARSALFRTARYQSSEKPSQTVNFDLLKLKTTSTTSGRYRNANAAAAYMLRLRFTKRPPRCGGPAPERQPIQKASRARW